MNTNARPTHQMQLVLDEHAKMGPLPIESLSAELARQVPLLDRAAAAVYGHHFAKKALIPFPLPVGNVQHHLIPLPQGERLARVYTPKGSVPSTGWPIILYLHGGGWVIANLDTYDASCRALCDGADAVVVALHYRQAPEYPWPAAAEDTLATYRWLIENGTNFDGDPARIAVAGESAGGNLAAVASQMARDQGLVLPVHQLLVYPVTNLADGFDNPSALENAEAKPLNRAMLPWFYHHYVPDPAQRAHPYASPLHAAAFTGLPPATILLAEIDPLRNDGEHYAAKLQTAGVSTTLKIYPGVTHEFFGLAGLVNEATEAVALAVKNLRAAFDPETP